MSTARLYFETVRRLRPVQIPARIWFRLYRPTVDLRSAPAVRQIARDYCEPIAPEPSLIAPTTFRLLNVERSCASAADWHPRDADKLWVYNLHYFDDLNARDARLRAAWHAALIDRWVNEVVPGRDDAWEPYPVSRRIVNWVKWSLAGNRLSPRALDSLAAQARWLTRRLEYHLLANHLFVNAKALVYAGLYFTGAEAEGWLRRGMALLEREVPEQVLGDGAHFELSPMYHAALLEDLLDLINLHQAYGLQAPSSWHDAAARMRQWLQAMIHPDGEVAFFNDCAFGGAPTAAMLEQYAARLQLDAVPVASDALQVLTDSGYVHARAGSAYLLCDCGPVGPSYQPGHAHADTLSFELSLRGRRVLVNSGTSQYGGGAERQRQRGTAAHNTVVVDGQDSSEVWAGFRVARRARTSLLRAERSVPLLVEASHDGYRRLPGRNEHRRSWALAADGLHITDHVSGRHGAAVAFFHVHPELDAKLVGADEVLLLLDGRTQARMSFEGAAAVEVEIGTWHPGFGISVANRRICARFAGTSLHTRIDWKEMA